MVSSNEEVEGETKASPSQLATAKESKTSPSQLATAKESKAGPSRPALAPATEKDFGSDEESEPQCSPNDSTVPERYGFEQ